MTPTERGKAGSELSDAYILISFFSKLHEEENGEANQGYKKETSTENQIRSFSRIHRLVQVLIEKPSSSSQADHSYE